MKLVGRLRDLTPLFFFQGTGKKQNLDPLFEVLEKNLEFIEFRAYPRRTFVVIGFRCIHSRLRSIGPIPVRFRHAVACLHGITVTPPEPYGVSNYRKFDCSIDSLCGLPTKETPAPHHWSFVRGISLSRVNFPHKGLATWKAFPCHDVIPGQGSLRKIHVKIIFKLGLWLADSTAVSQSKAMLENRYSLTSHWDRVTQTDHHRFR